MISTNSTSSNTSSTNELYLPTTTTTTTTASSSFGGGQQQPAVAHLQQQQQQSASSKFDAPYDGPINFKALFWVDRGQITWCLQTIIAVICFMEALLMQYLTYKVRAAHLIHPALIDLNHNTNLPHERFIINRTASFPSYLSILYWSW